MRVFFTVLITALILIAIAIAVLHRAGGGAYGVHVTAGSATEAALPKEVLTERFSRNDEAARTLKVDAPKQILFGDLHVHSSFSIDAFQLTLPTAGGHGLHPVADACDFARFCAQLDFWSINDHAASLTPRRWQETIDTIRQCDALAGEAEERDLISFLGWEWTQMGSTPLNHYGHKNVVLRDLEDGQIPTRPIAAAPPKGVPSTFDTGGGRGGQLALGIAAFVLESGHDLVAQIAEIQAVERCPLGVPVRDLPEDCAEAVETPGELFDKLDDWGFASTVIPHGTVWGMYTPAGSSWTKQLTPEQHDPYRQRIVEIYSGHGNAEEYRPWKAVEIDAEGRRRCPDPTRNYTPSCWRAGEIIRDRCLEEGNADDECEMRAGEARQYFVNADRNAGPWTVPGLDPHDLGEAGQCLDCFQPAFNFRPQSSVQAILALGRPEAPEGARRFRFGIIGSSDNHTARPGTGYKEVARREFTDARMGEVGKNRLVSAHRREPTSRAEAFPIEENIPSVAFLEAERAGSFFLSGGLAAVHARSRDRGEVFAALERRETYGTSGPRILLWFDLLDPNAPGGVWPMGSEVEIAGTPTFRARAAGSFEQKPGCPDYSADALGPDRLEALCLGECYFPSDRRRPIERIEVVRIRTQRTPDEDLSTLIEDPWRSYDCPASPDGCEVVFTDPSFSSDGRETSYYVRAIEIPSLVIAADPLGCMAADNGACLEIDPCFDRPDDDDCKAPSSQRAWSSPIFVDPRRNDETTAIAPPSVGSRPVDVATASR